MTKSWWKKFELTKFKLSLTLSLIGTFLTLCGVCINILDYGNNNALNCHYICGWRSLKEICKTNGFPKMTLHNYNTHSSIYATGVSWIFLVSFSIIAVTVGYARSLPKIGAKGLLGTVLAVIGGAVNQIDYGEDSSLNCRYICGWRALREICKTNGISKAVAHHHNVHSSAYNTGQTWLYFITFGVISVVVGFALATPKIGSKEETRIHKIAMLVSSGWILLACIIWAGKETCNKTFDDELELGASWYLAFFGGVFNLTAGLIAYFGQFLGLKK